jgi:signal transduction histidine kinase
MGRSWRQRVIGPGRSRWSIRLRLTVLYGAVFLVCGTALLAITYVLLANRLHTAIYHATSKNSAVAGPPGALPGSAEATQQVPLSPPDVRAIANGVRATAYRQRADSLHQLLVDSGIALAIMAMVSTGLGWFVAGQALRPLGAMAAAAQQLTEHSLDERLPTDGPRDELGKLASTFNAVLERLETAFESQRRFVANASHELRTPLTVQRTIMEVILADPDPDWRAACRQLIGLGEKQEQLIEALLTLARSQGGVDRREAVDIAAIAAAAVGTVDAAAATSAIRIETELRPSNTLGDPRLVERLITNLITNAVRHNHQGGWVLVRTNTIGPSATLEITNSGPTVAADQIPRLLQPFQRLGTNRTNGNEGLGLGLSIVQAIATTHNAALTIQPAPEGGFMVNVRFPTPPTAAGTGLGPPSTEPAETVQTG